MLRRSVVSVFVFAAFGIAASAQPKGITKEEYDRAFERAGRAATYPYRETVEFKPYTDHDSPEALYADEGVKILSQTAVTEHAGPGRLRTTVTTETEKGKTVVQTMQIDWACYSLKGTRWKETESCSTSGGFTIGRAPEREEYSVERTILNGVPVRAFRRVEIAGSDRTETGFFVDGKGRMVRREYPNRIATYKYGVRIKPVSLRAAPAPKRTANRRRSR